MSNVTPTEIVELVCAAYAVPRHRIGRPLPPHLTDERRWQHPGYEARICAVYLIQRHTRARPHQVCEAVGMKRQHGDKFLTAVEKFALRAANIASIAETVERLETAIDELHERRVDLAIRAGHSVGAPNLTVEADRRGRRYPTSQAA